ncbi:MAG: hypothetical protein BroJett012_07360 [Betaproteobacteria bacterium]|nr:MAG: hypothetical protein BroJett012_07360 [Betaproteobacteria bacterium]
MIETIKYQNQKGRNSQDTGSFFKGRNGYGIQTGIEVYATSDIMRLTPISTKGAANCHIEIPLSEVERVAQEMLRHAKRGQS